MRHRGTGRALFLLTSIVALGLLALVWAVNARSSEASPDAMQNCPHAGKWAISVWDGAPATDTGQALGTCGAGAVAAAYYLDPDTQGWSRWFDGRPDLSNLATLDGGQGVITLGGIMSLTSALGEELLSAAATTMLSCPQPGKWAISVWDGAPATDTGQALGTCGAGAVAAAYYLDPNTQAWLRWFAGRPDISNLPTLNTMQGIIALGATGAPPPTATQTAAPTATPTAAPTATPEPSARILFASYRDGNWEVYVMNADGTSQSNLTNNPDWDYQPDWSPDGSQIAFGSSRDGYSDVFVMSTRGTGQTNLTNSPSTDGDPAWSPDGTKIAFGSDRDGITEIYVMNAEGANLTRLTSNTVVDSDPAWSPEGSRIAFASERDGNGEIYVMNADGSAPTRLTHSTAWDSQPAWSPDGSRIAFVSVPNMGGEIYVMNADGSDPTNLTNDTAWDFSPAWSADGSKIVFASDRDGDEEIYMMNADGTDVIKLTENEAQDTDPAWSPAP